MLRAQRLWASRLSPLCAPWPSPARVARQDHTAPDHACPWARVESDGPSRVTHEDRTAHARRVQTANVCTSHTPSSGSLWSLDMHNITTSRGLGRSTMLVRRYDHGQVWRRDESSFVRCTDLRRRITCSPFFSQQLISYCITVGVAARNYFQLQLQPRSLHGIIFQFRLQPRSRYGKTVSNDNI